MGEAAGEDEVSDRISELPDSVIHHIYGFMFNTKDVVRTTVLSKDWKRVFYSYPSFDFDRRWFTIQSPEGGFKDLKEFHKWNRERKEKERVMFKEYVEKSLATRLDRLERVDKFTLYAADVDIQRAAGWIRAAVAKNLKELRVKVNTRQDCELPVDLTQSSSISRLKIKGNLSFSLAATKMCNLKAITIKRTNFLDANVMKELEENCPLLEGLRLLRCSPLPHLEISSLVKLRSVKVRHCHSVRRITIAAPNLEIFSFYAKKNHVKCRVDLKCCPNLRDLTLKDDNMTDSEFENCISTFPLLGEFGLYKCTSLENLKIRSLTLKSLALLHCSKLDEVEVDAPNLNSFHYIGRVMSSPLINAPRLSEVNFCFIPYQKRSNAEIQSFFSNFDVPKGVKFINMYGEEYEDF